MRPEGFSEGSSGGFEDTGEQLNIIGGSLTVNSGGDGLDSNGAMTINGGTLIALGAAGMGESPSSSEGQVWIFATASGAAGSTLTISDSEGAELASFTSPKSFGSMVFSAPGVTNGEECTLSVDGASTPVSAGEAPTGGMGGGGMLGPRG